MTLSQAKDKAWAILEAGLPHWATHRPGKLRGQWVATLAAVKLRNRIANALLTSYREGLERSIQPLSRKKKKRR